jgi:Uma2 family endonuclease
MSTATLPPPTAAPADDEALNEIVNGVRVDLPPMSVQSNWIATRLCSRLEAFVESHRLGTVVGEMRFILDRGENLRRRPHVAVASAERRPLDRSMPAVGDWDVVPDLTIEVVSPNDDMEGVLKKVGESFDHGVRQAWFVVPGQQLVYVCDSLTDVRGVAGTADLETSLVPRWKLPVATHFRRPQP